MKQSGVSNIADTVSDRIQIGIFGYARRLSFLLLDCRSSDPSTVRRPSRWSAAGVVITFLISYHRPPLALQWCNDARPGQTLPRRHQPAVLLHLLRTASYIGNVVMIIRQDNLLGKPLKKLKISVFVVREGSNKIPN